MQEQTTLPPGAAIQGRYIVKSLLGRSNSSATYLVRDQHVGNSAGNFWVLKEVIEPDKQGRQRLASEGKLLERLRYPGLPRVHRVITHDKSKRVYLVMDYVAGWDLETLRQQRSEKLIPWPQVMSIVAPLLAVVIYLHNQRPSIIHGDIKPGNLIMPEGSSGAVLVGFGSSKAGDSPGATTSAKGPCYKAPEQYGGSIDARTDIYALGATCYTLVTGVLPPDTRSRLRQMSIAAIDPLVPVNNIVPVLPLHVGKAIERAMALDAQRRFSSVEQFREALWLPVERSAPVFAVSPVLKDSATTVPAGMIERTAAVGPAPEKPLLSPFADRPAPVDAEEPEDPDATIRLPPLRGVKRIRESAEKREYPDQSVSEEEPIQ